MDSKTVMKQEIDQKKVMKCFKLDSYVLKVLDGLQYYGPCTRAELSRHLGLAIGTIQTAFDKLKGIDAIYVVRYKMINGHKVAVFSNRIYNVRIVYDRKPKILD